MRRFLYKFLADRNGLTSIEYGLIVMAISLAVMTAYFFIGESLETVFSTMGTQFEHAQSAIAE